MTNQKCPTVGSIPESNIKIVERGKIDTSDTEIHDLWPLTHKYMTSHVPGRQFNVHLGLIYNCYQKSNWIKK